jgi:hypothetical protein
MEEVIGSIPIRSTKQPFIDIPQQNQPSLGSVCCLPDSFRSTTRMEDLLMTD